MSTALGRTHVLGHSHLFKFIAHISGGSRNFKTGGAVEFLGLGFVKMPLHTDPMCLNKIHNVNSVY